MNCVNVIVHVQQTDWLPSEASQWLLNVACFYDPILAIVGFCLEQRMLCVIQRRKGNSYTSVCLSRSVIPWKKRRPGRSQEYPGRFTSCRSMVSRLILQNRPPAPRGSLLPEIVFVQRLSPLTGHIQHAFVIPPVPLSG